MKEPISLRNFIKNIKKQNKPKATYSEKPKKHDTEYVSGYASIGDRKDITTDFVEPEKHTDNPNYVSGYASIGDRKDIEINPKKKLKEWIYDQGTPVKPGDPVEPNDDYADKKDGTPDKEEETYQMLEAHHNGTKEKQRAKYENPHIENYVTDSSRMNRTLIDAYNSGSEEYKNISNREEGIRDMDRTLADFEEPAPEDHYVYSGLGRDISAHEAYKSGKGIHLPAYTSTSTDPNVSQGFARKDYSKKPVSEILRIKIPKGSRHGVFLGSGSPMQHEREMILHRNRHLRFVGEPRRNGNHLIFDTEFANEPNEDAHLEEHRKLAAVDNPHKEALSKQNATEEQIHDAFKKGSHSIKLQALGHKNVGKKTLSDALDDDNDDIRDKASQSPKLDSDHLHQIIDSDKMGESEKASALHYNDKKLDTSHIDKVIDKHNDSREMMGAIASSKNLTDAHLHHFLDHDSGYMNTVVRFHPNLKDDHIHKMIDSGKFDGNVMDNLFSQGKLNAEHNAKILKKYPDHYVKNSILSSGELNDDTIDDVINNGSYSNHYDLSENNNLKPHHIRKLLDKSIESKNGDMISKLARSTRMDSDSLHKLYAYAHNTDNESLKRTVIRHRNASHGLLNRAIEDKSPVVRKAVLENQNATPEHIDRGLDDEDSDVRSKAAGHENASEDNLDKALKDKDPNVAEVAAYHPNLSERNLHTALSHPDEYVRVAAAMHDNLNSDHLHRAIKDESNVVRSHAARHPNIQKQHWEVLQHDSNEVRAEKAKKKLKELSEND